MRKRCRLPLEEEGGDEPLINLTPLIDVVFVVLIAFMLVSPVLEIDPVDLAASGGSAKQSLSANSAIAVTVSADNTIFFQGKAIAMAQLEKQLKELRKKNKTATAQLIQDRKASFGTYQAIKNAFEAAGFEQMDVVLKPGS